MGYILCVRSWDHVCTRGINTQDFFEKKIFLEKKLRTRTKAKIGKVKKNSQSNGRITGCASSY